MWTCQTCSETHEDNFQVCWKCAGTELERPIESAPMPTGEERTLRPFGAILFRAIIAAVIGTIGGMAIFHRNAASFAEAAAAGLFLGLGFGVAVGLFIWVCFPYAPKAPGRNDSAAGAPGAPAD